jgi:hypothetical protein
MNPVTLQVHKFYIWMLIWKNSKKNYNPWKELSNVIWYSNLNYLTPILDVLIVKNWTTS